jgi:hypothetical protein
MSLLKNRPKCDPNNFLGKNKAQLIKREKQPKCLANSIILDKTAQNKQLPNRRKIAQSGHPGSETLPTFESKKTESI